jgi:hypothetical protein
MRILSLAGLVAFLMLAVTACKEKKTPEEILCEQISYEPYSIEHYELRTSPDTSIVVYFSREVSDDDCGIHLISDFKNDSDSTVLSQELLLRLKKTNNRKLIYKLPLREDLVDKAPGFTSHQLFTNSKLNYLKGKYADVRVRIYPSFPSAPVDCFSLKKGKLWVLENFTKFSRSVANAPHKKICSFNDTLQLWSKDNTRYYKGSFDSEGRKQGYWRWNYSTGTIQAEGYFKNDSLIGTLKMYNYQGQIIGTVFSSNEQLP